MRNGMVSALDSRWTGQEPTWEGASEWTDEKIYHTFTRALDFYGYYLDLEDYIPIILEYLKNENPKDKTSLDNIKKSPRCVEIIILGKLARMINLGMPIRHSGKNYKKKINSYLKTISDNVLLLTVEKETVKKGPSIFDIMQTKLRYGVIVHLDTMLDKWIRNNTVDVNKINVTSLLQSVGANSSKLEIKNVHRLSKNIHIFPNPPLNVESNFLMKCFWMLMYIDLRRSLRGNQE